MSPYEIQDALDIFGSGLTVKGDRWSPRLSGPEDRELRRVRHDPTLSNAVVSRSRRLRKALEAMLESCLKER